jgi:glyoxalase/bleomycin resistance protein/dioxygenase superfamily protein
MEAKLMNEKVDLDSALKCELKGPVQIGILVKDLERTTRQLYSLFGFGPFHFVEWPDRPESKYYYRGKQQHIKNHQAFVQVGPVELEFIQLVEGDRNAFRDFLDQKGEGIHHILFEVEDMDAVINTLSKAGVGVLQSGTGIRPGTRWALLDTQDLLGFLVELRQRAPGSDGTSIPKDRISDRH